MTFFSLSSYVSSLCSPGLPSRVFITYDQIEVGQMHHSEAKFHTAVFFLGETSGSVAPLPLETQWLWTWLAAWLASQL